MFWTTELVKVLHSLQSSYLLIPGNPYNSPDFVGNILERKVKISLFLPTSGRLFGEIISPSSSVGRLDFSSVVAVVHHPKAMMWLDALHLMSGTKREYKVENLLNISALWTQQF